MYPEYDCSKCTSDLKKYRGCDGGGAIPYGLHPDDEKLDRCCPRRPLLDNPGYFHLLLNSYRRYKNGFLPTQGGIAQQPGKLLVLFDEIDVILNECEKAHQESEKRKQSRGQHHGPK